MRRITGIVTLLVIVLFHVPCIAQEKAQATDRIKQFEAALASNPGDRTTMVELANAYFDSGAWAQAERWYGKALELDDEDANVLTDLGTVQRRLGEPLLALETFDRALAVDPQHWQTLYNKSLVLIYDLDRGGEAVGLLDTLERMRVERPDIPDLAQIRSAAELAPAPTPAPLDPDLEKAARELVRRQIPEEYLEEMYHQGAQMAAVAVENQIQPTIKRAVTDTEHSRLLILCYKQVKALMPYSVLEDLLYPIVARHLTLEDLNAINDFLATPAGQKLASVQAALAREGQGAGEELGRRMAGEEWGQQMARDLREQFPQWFSGQSPTTSEDP